MSSPYQAYGHLPYSNVNTASTRYPYPPHTSEYDASNISLGRESFHERDVAPLKQESSKVGSVAVGMHHVSRTPSPTPSEEAELKKTSFFDLKAMRTWKYWIRREWLWYYVIGIVATVFVILITVFHKQIVDWLQPAANWVHDLPAGWLIPIAIFFVISFPPLFGHEILAILCGLVWGLWIGFAIVAAGTFLGELGNFYAFKYCCAARGKKLEQTQISYACLARVVREGGFKVALIARFSAIPGHFTTAVFSTCGMSVWTFSIAAILSLPKQFITVYLGVALEQSESGKTSTTDTVIKYVVLVVTGLVTVGAMWYIYHRMNKVKPAVIYDRRKARQAKLSRAAYGGPGALDNDSTTSVAFNPNDSEANLPLNSAYQHQQWDSNGRAVGHSGDPTLYAPKPQRAIVHPVAAGSAASSTASLTAPAMIQRDGYTPHRQNTDQSTASWDAQATVGNQNVYQMTRKQSPPSNPFADSARIPPPPSSAPSHAYDYGATPPSFMYPGGSPSPQTATQANFPPYTAPPLQATVPLALRGKQVTATPPPLPSLSQSPDPYSSGTRVSEHGETYNPYDPPRYETSPR